MAQCCHKGQLFPLTDASTCVQITATQISGIVAFKSLAWFMLFPWFQQNNHGMHADHRIVLMVTSESSMLLVSFL